MATDFAQTASESTEAHQAAIAAMPLQLLNYSAGITAQEAEALKAEARRQLGRLTSQPWRMEDDHAVMGDALREAARLLAIDPSGLELRRDRPGRPPEPAVDKRTRPRTICLNDAHWEKLKALGTAWLERKLDAEPGA
ncbi:hypothetical protein [uncultured Azohydromonas sp.]|jgi:hypothetical protein|uniref:hypothetical protein n=1 Tax=uncultured Azohydromonas sp. TaxID=487342 RepID=UPI0026068D06|nr:hypothetical protein [uncultured Azohydromonas sp.]